MNWECSKSAQYLWASKRAVDLARQASEHIECKHGSDSNYRHSEKVAACRQKGTSKQNSPFSHLSTYNTRLFFILILLFLLALLFFLFLFNLAFILIDHLAASSSSSVYTTLLSSLSSYTPSSSSSSSFSTSRSPSLILSLLLHLLPFILLLFLLPPASAAPTWCPSSLQLPFFPCDETQWKMQWNIVHRTMDE